MTAYEVMVIFKPQMEEEALANAVSRVEETIKNIKGEITRKTNGENAGWPTDCGFTEGYYLLLQTKLPRTEIRS